MQAKASLAAAARASEESQGSAWHDVDGLAWDGHADDSQEKPGRSSGSSASKEWVSYGMRSSDTRSHHQRTSNRNSKPGRNRRPYANPMEASRDKGSRSEVPTSSNMQEEEAVLANGIRSAPSREDTFAAAIAHR